MKKHLAHALRRTARRMIAWSNRLDRPIIAAPSSNSIVINISNHRAHDEAAGKHIAEHLKQQRGYGTK